MALNLIELQSLKSTSHKVDVVWYPGATTASDTTVSLANTLNLAMVALDGTEYKALSVVIDSTNESDNFITIKSRKFRISDSGDAYSLIVGDTGGSTVPIKAIVIQTAHLAVNNDSDLILVDSGIVIGTIPAGDNYYIHLGDRPLRCVKSGGKWYLVVAEV